MLKMTSLAKAFAQVLSAQQTNTSIVKFYTTSSIFCIDLVLCRRRTRKHANKNPVSSNRVQATSNINVLISNKQINDEKQSANITEANKHSNKQHDLTLGLKLSSK